jgi:antitoxin (DNA-binding transcriptional repressor) of toxin-antitoxin stability system
VTFKVPFMCMKTITVKEMKANWAQIEAQVKAGETFEVLNRGKVAAQIVPAKPRPVLRWPDHLATAHKNTSRKGSELIRDQRDGRF